MKRSCLKLGFCSILLIVFNFFTNVKAQIPENFQGIYCEGPIPDDFTKLFTNKLQDDLTRGKQEDNMSSKNSEEFAAQTNFFNDNLIMSGSVLFGDPISTLCQRICDSLLRNRDSPKKIRVYTLKSSMTNAFSTTQGIIYVTIGLISRMQNEAQLAFVLAHEIAHVLQDHNLQSYKNKKDFLRGKNDYQNLNFNERILRAYQYSHKAEFEADSLGHLLFMEAGYDGKAIIEQFDILRESYLPIAQNSLNWDQLEDDCFKMPKQLKLGKVMKIKLESNFQDSFLTHPNIKKRKDAILTKQINSSNSGKVYILSNLMSFESITYLAQFELIRCLMHETQYMKALYTIWAIKARQGSHLYLQRAELICWAAIQKYANHHSKYTLTYSETAWDETQGDLQQLHFLLTKIDRKSLNIMTLRQVWKLAASCDDSLYAHQVQDQVLKEFMMNVRYDSAYYFTTNMVCGIDSADSTYNFHFALNLPLSDPVFAKAFYMGLSQRDTSKIADAEVPDKAKTWRFDVNRIYDYHYDVLELIDTLLMLTPRYFQFNYNGSAFNNIYSIKSTEAFLTKVSNIILNELPLSANVLNDRTASTFTTESFNDFVVIQDWINYKSDFSGSDFYSFNQPMITGLYHKYGGNYLAIPTVFSVTIPRYFVRDYTAHYRWPTDIYLGGKQVRSLYYNFLVINLKEGTIDYQDIRQYRKRFRKDLIKNEFYHTLKQISK